MAALPLAIVLLAAVPVSDAGGRVLDAPTEVLEEWRAPFSPWTMLLVRDANGEEDVASVDVDGVAVDLREPGAGWVVRVHDATPRDGELLVFVRRVSPAS